MEPSRAQTPSSTACAYRFGAFEVDLRAQLLRRSGEPVPLTKKSFDTLVHLVRNRGRLVPRDELIAAVWPDVIVEEGNLHWTISAVRKALGGDGADAVIQTVRGQGYRFLPEISEVVEPEPFVPAVETSPPPPAELAPKRAGRRVLAAGLAALALAAFLPGALRRDSSDGSHPPASLPAGDRARLAYEEGLAALRGL
ncbi:MAG TPA: transcriptional regulator, partial [Thermoanaerobaculia bacterium]|nr:transcriptional regulator [Thermoanaerobaculia bacterium]